MTEYTVAEATARDYDRVLPLLRQLGADHVTDAQWRGIFDSPWSGGQNARGYLLIHDSMIEGFLGAIFSERQVRGVPERFCNMTSWIVRPEARGASLQLLAPMLGLRDHTITNFTPSLVVARILKAMRFTEILGDQIALFAIPALSRRPLGWRLSSEPSEIISRLSPEDRTILADHLGFECHHALLEAGGSSCYVILKRVRRGRLWFGRPHYVSDVDFFSRHLDHARAGVSIAMRVAGLIVEEKYLLGRRPRFSRRYARDARWFVRSTTVSPGDVDTLYSELILLHA